MREHDPDVLVWVAMQHFHPGADRLLLTDRAVIAKALRGVHRGRGRQARAAGGVARVYEKLDSEIVDVVTDGSGDGPVARRPHRLPRRAPTATRTSRSEGPDRRAGACTCARSIDPLLARLGDRLRERGALDNRWVVVTVGPRPHRGPARRRARALDGGRRRSAGAADEGRVPRAPVPARGARRTPTSRPSSPTRAPWPTCTSPIARRAPRRARPATGRARRAIARTCCASPTRSTATTATASLVPALRGTLDLVLVRRPRPVADDDLPFEVYVGHGRPQPIAAYLRAHPHPTYVDFERGCATSRSDRTASAPATCSSSRTTATAPAPTGASTSRRRYRSWHGSPSRQDSEIPLIVAHPKVSTDAIEALVRNALLPAPRQQRLTQLLLRLREPDSTGTTMARRSPR